MTSEYRKHAEAALTDHASRGVDSVPIDPPDVVTIGESNFITLWAEVVGAIAAYRVVGDGVERLPEVPHVIRDLYDQYSPKTDPSIISVRLAR